MLTATHPAFLRTVLSADAATCVATGLLTTFGASTVARLTHLPEGVLMASGASLFPVAAFMAFVASRTPTWTAGVWLVILGNIGWVLASVLLLASGQVAPNALGTAFVLVQAAAVAALAWLEMIGVRQTPVLA